MSLVDTVIHELNNWQYKGYKLKDAQIFKIEMDVWTEKDERKWNNEMEKVKAHLDKLRAKAEASPTIKKEDRSILRERWHSAEEGSFSFPKSKPPYSNIIISLRAGERNRVLWLLDNFCTEEDCKKKFNHYSLTQLFPILDFSNPSSWWGVGKTYEELTHPTTSANVCMHFWQEKEKKEGGKIPLNMMGPFDLTDHCSSIPQWARFLYAQNIYTVMKVCSIINCSNIALDKHEVPDKVNRKRKRKNKKTLSPYYTLKIKPKSSYEKKGKKSGKESKPRQLHLVRGHFKHYTEEAPLFGKHTGLYWWQPHVRGEEIPE